MELRKPNFSREIRILMLEDNDLDAELIELKMRNRGLNFRAKRVENEADFVRELESGPPEVILSDYSLPSFDGLSALAIARQLCPDVPFIFVTGTMGEEAAIETLKKGATDYVLKTRLSRLVPSVHRALREAHERAERKKAERQLHESHERLRALSTHLQTVREDERTRIALEVHDELGQALTGLKLDLWRLAGQPPQGRNSHGSKIKSLVARVNATIQTVRRIATELRPGILDNLGLVAAIEWQAAEFESRSGLKCIVRADPKVPRLGPDLNTAFFRIFQETLTNVIRHARAKRVEVHLSKQADLVVLAVHDNGRGISEAEISNIRSVGLCGMRERAALFGGQVNIRGLPGHGTTVTVHIPRQRGPETASLKHSSRLALAKHRAKADPRNPAANENRLQRTGSRRAILPRSNRDQHRRGPNA